MSWELVILGWILGSRSSYSWCMFFHCPARAPITTTHPHPGTVERRAPHGQVNLVFLFCWSPRKIFLVLPSRFHGKKFLGIDREQPVRCHLRGDPPRDDPWQHLDALTMSNIRSWQAPCHSVSCALESRHFCERFSSNPWKPHDGHLVYVTVILKNTKKHEKREDIIKKDLKILYAIQWLPHISIYDNQQRNTYS